MRINNTEVGRLLKGECFGEMAILSRKERGASVTALDECTLLQVDSRLLEHASSGCQLRFSHVFVQTLIERLASSNERLAEALTN